MKRRLTLSLVVYMFLCVGARAQPARMTNADVVKMVASGLPEEIVIGAVKSTKVRDFDTTVDGLIELKKNKVPDAVIAAMMESPAPTSPAPGAVLGGPPPGVGAGGMVRMVASGDQNDPAQPHDSGIYLDMGQSANPRLVLLTEPKIIGQTSGGLLKTMRTMGMGASMNWRVRGGRAETRTSQNPPVFYFYGSDPDDSHIVEMHKKGDEREFTFIRVGAISGDLRGTKAAVPVKVEKIATGIYRVTPSTPLKRGEYGFTGSSLYGAGGVKEFGVDK